MVPRENTAWHTRSLGVNRKKQSITLVGNLSEIQRKVNFSYYTWNRRGGHRIQTILYSLALFDNDI